MINQGAGEADALHLQLGDTVLSSELSGASVSSTSKQTQQDTVCDILNNGTGVGRYYLFFFI